MRNLLVIATILLLLLAPWTGVEAVTIDFEALADLDSVTTQFPGLTFSNTTALTAGISLNEFEFPPLSGVNVVFDDGGPMSILFAVPQASVGGFFTYLTPLTFTAFNGLGDVIGIDTSNVFSNLALSGDLGSSPNEFLGVSFPGGISRVIIQGDPVGSSFTLDNLSANPVPEPSTLLLLGSGLAAAIGWRGVRKARNHTRP